MAEKNKKKCSTSLIIRGTQIKTTVRYYLTPVRMAIIKKTRSSKCWWGCGKTGVLCIFGGSVNWGSHYVKQYAAAAAKLIQLCPTLCDPWDGSPSGSTVPGILQARTLEWVAISFSKAWKWKVKAKSLSGVRLFTIPWTAAYQAPPSMGFSRQENWSGLPLPSPVKQYRGSQKNCKLNCIPSSRFTSGYFSKEY